MMKRLLTAALLTAIATACPASEEEEAANASAELISKVCARQSECCPRNESVAECEADLRLVLDPLFTLDGIAVDSAKLEACVAKMGAAGCDEVAGYGGILPALAYCGQFWSGTLANGESCGGSSLITAIYGDDQCASGRCASGKCVAAPKLGESCAEVECEAELVCGLEADECAAPLASGAECSAYWECAEGFGCLAAETIRTCQPLTVIKVGEECGGGKLCELGESMCFCPVGSEGCATGLCGNTSRCLK